MVKIKKIIIAAILIIGFFFFLYQFSPSKIGTKQEIFVLPLQVSQDQIVDKLQSEGFIKSKTAFNWILTLKGDRGEIASGGYFLSKNMWAWEIAEILVNHPSQTWVFLSEGLRKEEIAEILENKVNWPEDEKENFLTEAQEGYLFPDTYLIDLDWPGEKIAKRLYSQFEENVADLFQEAESENIRTDTLIVLASLIQREAANENEMPLLAGIIWNRWLGGIPFQIDATIQYVLGELGNWWPIIKKEDYKIDSPYNTYLHKGRPPSPICNPGLAAINAVIHSEDSDYLYYIHDNQGQIHLAKTYEEHLKNIAKYLK
jgi:UPF0755 protein